MFVFVSHLTVPDADHGSLKEHFRGRSGLVDDFPGFLHLQLLKPQAGTGAHTFMTTWTDADMCAGDPYEAEARLREPFG